MHTEFTFSIQQLLLPKSHYRDTKKTMDEFELFTMIFFAIDSYYEDNPSEGMKVFLGMMSPFTFKEADSADSAIFAEFKKFINGRTITVDNSLDLAKEYAKIVSYCDITVAFNDITQTRWVDACNDYLSRPHKGMSEPKA